MDFPPAPDRLSELVEIRPSILPQPDGVSIPEYLPQLRDRRREKPLLSCTFCRSRKYISPSLPLFPFFFFFFNPHLVT